uniref:Putative synaptic vesicle transporter svop n=1 Tax=Xenopsylla cheopis TaxID=163159 RepID=A0A6M2DXK0_XENCH
MSIVFNLSYPIGMLILAVTAYYVPQWRDLQLAISLPTVLLLFHCWYLPESPRWLINKGRGAEAAKIVFGTKLVPDTSLDNHAVKDKYTKVDDGVSFQVDHRSQPTLGEVYAPTKTNMLMEKLKKSVKEMTALFRHKEMRRRLFICHFCWMGTSLGYYAMALNVDNFAADRYIYVALTGALEIPSYFVPLPMLKFFGRRIINFILFMVASLCLLSILAIPQDSSVALMIVGLIGRLCVSGVFSVVILHTSELFPTLNRNSAIGSSSTMAHVGSIAAPYIVDLLV